MGPDPTSGSAVRGPLGELRHPGAGCADRKVRPESVTGRAQSPREASLRPAVIAWVVLVSLALAAPAAGSDSVYRYIDERGVVHFSDTPVDDRYRRNRIDRIEGLAIAPPPARRGPGRRDFDILILTLGQRHRVQPALVKAVIAAESNFQPGAVSRAGAQGLMQLMPATARSLGVQKPFAVVENVDGGVRYLREMLDRYGDVTRALAAYNAGPSAVDRYHGVPPYPETQAYVKRVLEYYRGYRGEFEARAARERP
ncbi:MAG: lytic transglycosylase domain-containing protein [Deltaproteobacteria bacterium]|nr:lytic transglycosylase domain-containing protein [Deltaproteobacteria bacterium]